MPQSVSVLDVLKDLFPTSGHGQPPYPLWIGQKVTGDDSDYYQLPIHPFNVFAATARLVELSGAYHHIVSGGDNETRRRFRRGRLRQRSARMLALSPSQLRACCKQGKIWRDRVPSGAPSQAARAKQMIKLKNALIKKRNDLAVTAETWAALFEKFGKEPVFAKLSATSSSPEWWVLALRLMVTADEACEGVGFTRVSHDHVPWEELSWFERPYVNRMLEEYDKRIAAAETGDTSREPVHRALAYTSLSDARQDVACVLPKARTTAVGCTMRSLSHHLALLPAKGIARGRWYPAADLNATLDDVELNILLVPFPFSMTDNAFHGFLGRSTIGSSFGFFELKQEWLGQPDTRSRSLFVDKLYSFIVDLATDALTTHQAATIDAIVFPELALSFDIFSPLKARLKQRFPELEIFISGLSDDGRGRQGNFVAVSAMPKGAFSSSLEIENRIRRSVVDDDSIRPTIREKHHRWKLDSHQLGEYGLSGVLSPKLDWWEDIDLLSRCVDFTVFRKNSVLAAMICEDLARVDPCQELLRAIGPNLVVALLMDAPQLPTRWPARYATILSDDPGSSVLTLTSRALMTRQHVLGLRESKSRDDRVIALWRDDHYGFARPISCPIDCHGVLLKLWSSRALDTSLDGRRDLTGKTWIYGKHKALRIPHANHRYPDILGADDVSLQNSAAY